MKKIMQLGKTLSKQEQKKIVGGYRCSCTCNNGQGGPVICMDCNTSSCFNAVYGQCGGGGASCFLW